MVRQNLLYKFKKINVWTRGDERAPHKPLLLLYALSRIDHKEDRAIPYKEVDKKLRQLLIDFGPPRKSYHTEYPFWRLQNDGIWQLWNAGHLEKRRGNTDAKKSELLKQNVMGGLTNDVYQTLRRDKKLIIEVAKSLLDENFPESMHADILNAVGLRLGPISNVKPERDATFRYRVINAYEHRCAVCGFNIHLGASELGIEAAHIKWHQAGGPSVETNGLALCVLHHKLFDRGAFTVSVDYKVLVSQHVYGGKGFDEWLLRFHNASLTPPQSPEFLPKSEFVDWHQREVFKAPARYILG